MTLLRSAAALVAAACLASGLSGCGEDEPERAGEPSPSATTSAASSTADSAGSTPEDAGPRPCAEVWAGDRLPVRYRGCLKGGTLVRAERLECSSGQVIVTHAGRFYAVLGGPINDVGSLEDSKEFQQATRVCGA